MSGRKNTLLPHHLVVDGDLSGDFSSEPVTIAWLDNVAIQINAVTSDATGTFLIEGSLDYVPERNPGNWIPITLDPVPTLAGADTEILFDLNQLSFPYIRVSYASEPTETGTANVYISAKMV